MATDPTRATAREQTEHALRAKLSRLLRVREELWLECQPVPPELEDKIREVRWELWLDPPIELEWPTADGD